MAKKYDICTRLEIEGREKPLWPEIGMTLTVKDDGTMRLYDARTGQSYFCFERDQNNNQQQSSGSYQDHNDDGPPF